MRTLTILSVGLLFHAPSAFPAEPSGQQIDFSIDRQSLAEALLTFARVTGEQIIFPYDIANKYTATPLRGKLNATEALTLLLQETPLRTYRNPDGTIIIRFDVARDRELRLKDLQLEKEKHQEARNIALDDMISSLGEQEEAIEKKLLEELVITGSQLARQEVTTANPLSIVDSEMISTTGTVNVENAINRFSQVVPGLTAHSNNPGNGTVTVDLRGLGPTRTLVLVNGRRFAPSDQEGVVDLNAIPTILLDQVEIVTGGTSAVYGSGAISGVVNFILKDDFEGLLVDSQYKVSGQGDADKWNWDIVYGQSLKAGEGNIYFHLGYLNRSSLLQEDRDFSKYALSDYFIVDGSEDDRFGYGTPLASTLGGVPGLIRQGSSAIPGALVFGAPANGFYPGLQTFTPDGESIPYDGITDSYNFAPDNYLQVPQDRWMMTSGANYKLADGVDFFLQTLFVHNTVGTEIAPTPGFMSDVVIPVNNPFLNEEGRLGLQGLDWYGTGHIMQARSSGGELLFDAQGSAIQARQALDLIYNDQGILISANPLWNSDGTPVAAVGIPEAGSSGHLLFEGDGLASIPLLARRFTETGPRRIENKRNTFNIVLGTDIELSDQLVLSASYNHSNYTHDELRLNDISGVRLRNALNIIELDGEYVCASEKARDEGCVPANVFGEGNISQEAGDYISVDTTNRTEYTRKIASVQLNGELDSLLPDAISFLLGVDWREESSSLSVDEALASNEPLGFNLVEALSGKYSVTGIFGEINIPVLRRETHGHDLEVSGAFRLSDFSTSGRADSYAAGIFWSPMESLAIRGQYQRAVRTPNITELFAGRFEVFEDAADPCAAGHAESYPDIAGLCEATGVPLGQTGKFEQISVQIRSIYGGNENLKEEYSDTISVGFVFEPAFLENTQLTVDYYDIKIHDMIDVLAGGTENILNLCYRNGDINSSYCQSIHRLEGGHLDYINALMFNEGEAWTSGVDIQLFHFKELNGGLFSGADMLDIYFQGSYVFTYKLYPADGIEGYDCAGYFGAHCGDPHPRFRFTQMTTWTSGPLSLALRWRFLSKVKEGAVLSGANPEDLAVPSIPAESYFDLYLKYYMTDEITLRAGVDNVFNNVPRHVGTSQQQANTFPNFYDVLGPYFYFGVEARF